MSYNTIIIKKEEGIAKITLNRPETLNSIDPVLGLELVSAAQEVSKDDSVRVVILTGAGRGFCSGADLNTLGDKVEPVGILWKSRRYPEAVQVFRTMPKPLITAVNGPAAGAGLALALVGDFIIASEKATFSAAFVQLGLCSDMGLAYFLPRLVTTAKACDLMLTGRKVDADEAYRIGMVKNVVPAEKLEETVMELATELSRMPPIAVGMVKKTLYEVLAMDLPSVIELEARTQALCYATEDVQEGIKAFKEKRTPVFKGK